MWPYHKLRWNGCICQRKQRPGKTITFWWRGFQVLLLAVKQVLWLGEMSRLRNEDVMCGRKRKVESVCNLCWQVGLCLWRVRSAKRPVLCNVRGMQFLNSNSIERKGEIHLCSISLSQSILVLILTSAIASTTGVIFGLRFRFILSRCNSWMIVYSMNFELVNWWGWMCCNAPVTILDIPVIPSPHWLDPHWGCVDAERTASGLFEQGTWW